MHGLLDSKRVGSKSGLDSSLVILLHGYGANGDDLLGLADPMSEYLPILFLYHLMRQKYVQVILVVINGFQYLG